MHDYKLYNNTLVACGNCALKDSASYRASYAWPDTVCGKIGHCHRQGLEWLGHIARMPEHRIPKMALFGCVRACVQIVMRSRAGLGTQMDLYMLPSLLCGRSSGCGECLHSSVCMGGSCRDTVRDHYLGRELLGKG